MKINGKEISGIKTVVVNGSRYEKYVNEWVQVGTDRSASPYASKGKHIPHDEMVRRIKHLFENKRFHTWESLGTVNARYID